MDRPQSSDALKQYPLYGTPYTRHFGSAFNPSQSPSTVLSPQSYSWRPPRSHNCPCNCTQIASSTQYTDIQYSTPVKDNIISSARKRSLEEDSNKENQSPGLSSPPKKWKYKKQRTTDQKLYDIFKVIHDTDWGLSDFLYFVFRHKDTDGNCHDYFLFLALNPTALMPFH
jgi:hypothetical protein